ncbi:hypothetical protein BKA62DRAFT_739166 [Auriculariales sp. MPI-PUGE-AT-0066]|nr:hypothetical protein BKA62DRAFT_739166 [Auriculariales sp. MPI-PUGE-AT-0066]
MRYTLTTILFFAAAAQAMPLSSRQIKLDDAATKEAQQRDDTATRALTGVPIKTASGQCLTIDENSGDFRRNLMILKEAPCTGAATQQFDFITKGLHNDKAGTTLVVSTAFFNCLSFDDRKADNLKAHMFSCGGRADGSGQITDSQQFEFTNIKASQIPLAPLNGRGGICFAIANGQLSKTACTTSSPAANQTFTLGNGAVAVPPPAPANTSSATSSSASQSSSSAPPPAQTAAPAAPTGSVKLDDAATKEAQTRDDTATRALTAVPIKTLSGKCLTINVNSGDFRRNLMTLTEEACTGAATQQFDFITKGKHNDKAGTSLVVSTAFFNCLSFDDRKADNLKVHMFSCGGRADGSGQITDSQQFEFANVKAPQIPLAPINGRGGVCFAIVNGQLGKTDCKSSSPAADQTFTIGNNAGVTPAPTQASSSSAAPASSSPATTSAPTSAPASPAPTGSVKLNDKAVAEAQQRDVTATRALTATSIKTASGKCLTIDVNSGNFRRNLMTLTEEACTGAPTQQFDFITAGKHNNKAGNALIVSSAFNNCLSFDERKANGLKVHMFSCGGRADGSGRVATSQLFPFTGASKSIALAPSNGNAKLDRSACDAAKPAANQLFVTGN